MITRLSARRSHLLQGQPLTYDEVGATASEAPTGYHHVRRERVIGSGPADFAAASAALLSWQMHDRAGMAPAVSHPVVVPDSVAVLHFGWRALALPIPVRVVYTIDREDEQGFAYGTLPGHPEMGEERFAVGLRTDGSVVAVISAFSRPGRWFTRLGGPPGRLVQRLVTTWYLKALEQAALERSGLEQSAPGEPGGTAA